MNHKQLQYFITVVKTGSITKAAEELYISQPALSRCINKLEQEVGFPLLFRGAQGVSLTKAGEVYFRGVEKLMEIYKDTMFQARTTAEESLDTLAIACAYEEFNSEILFKLQEKYLDIRTHYSLLSPEQAYRELLAGKVDFAVLPDMPKNAAVAMERLMSEELLLSCGDGHPLRGRKKVDISELNGCVAACNEASFDRESISKVCAENGIEMKIRFVSNDHQQVGLYRRRYGCISFVPVSAVLPRNKPETRLDLVSPARLEPQVFRRNINIAWLVGRTFTKADKELLDKLRQYYRKLAKDSETFLRSTY